MRKLVSLDLQKIVVAYVILSPIKHVVANEDNLHHQTFQ